MSSASTNQYEKIAQQRASAEQLATQDPYELSLHEIDVANPYLFANNRQGPWFKRLRDEDPIHYCSDSVNGPYWSVTRYDDIMKVDTSHDIYSSEPNITIRDQDDDFLLPMFIAMPHEGPIIPGTMR